MSIGGYGQVAGYGAAVGVGWNNGAEITFFAQGSLGITGVAGYTYSFNPFSSGDKFKTSPVFGVGFGTPTGTPLFSASATRDLVSGSGTVQLGVGVKVAQNQLRGERMFGPLVKRLSVGAFMLCENGST